jgi:hypothetical protein
MSEEDMKWQKIEERDEAGRKYVALETDPFPFPFWNARGTSRDGLN